MEAFTYKEHIKRELENTVNKLVDTKKLPIVFGHVAWGRLSEQGTLRISHVKRNKDFQDSLLSKNVFFNKHIKQVGRNKTFLDFLLLYWYDNEEFKTNLKVERNFKFLIQEQNELIVETQDFIKINIELSEVLAPIDLITKYFKVLDDNFDFIPDYKILDDREIIEIKTYYLNELDACRFKALELFTRKRNNGFADDYNRLYEFSKKYNSTKFEQINIIHLLGAIQSALLFIKGSYPKESKVGFISKSCALQASTDSETESGSKTEKEILKNPIIVLSTPILDSDDSLTHEILNLSSIQTEIEKFYRNNSFNNTESICDVINNEIEKYLPKKSIKDKIDEKFQEYELFKIKPDWSKFILYWNSLLIQNLRNSIHEGSSLNFTFVVADASEIKDSGLFDIVKLKFQDNSKDLFHPYVNGKKLDKANYPYKEFRFLYSDKKEIHGIDLQRLLKHIKQNIEKKNYSWFQDGKYALLWDSTFPSKYPHSLIKIKNSSWEVFINEIRNQRCKELLSSISMSIVFLKQDQSGGLIIKDNLIASFRKGYPWSFGLDTKTAKIKDYLTDAFSKYDFNKRTELIELMSDVVLTISDDPHSGCILVISNEKPEFQSMGAPWQIVPANKIENQDFNLLNPIDLNKDELAALMGMDGATCIYLMDSKPVIEFRNILMIDISKLNRDFDKEDLDGEGSRKWSSLNTARLENINLVLAVSQDGPIYIYQPTSENKVEIKII